MRLAVNQDENHRIIFLLWYSRLEGRFSHWPGSVRSDFVGEEGLGTSDYLCRQCIRVIYRDQSITPTWYTMYGRAPKICGTTVQSLV